MVRYRRNFVPGGTFFFTVTLADRRSSVLVEHIAVLRAAFRVTRSERPFAIDAIVVLPDHLHTIITLPSYDSDFPADGGASKTFAAHHTQNEATQPTRRICFVAAAILGTPCETKRFSRHVDYIHYNPVKRALVSCNAIDRSPFHRYVRRGLLPRLGRAVDDGRRFRRADRS
jgi:putative transposase